MPTAEDNYNLLTSLINPFDAQVLEIDILPSQCSQDIQHDDFAIAIPKSILVQCYLIARKIFFSSEVKPPDCLREQTLLQATSVILLWDPNHVTAANWRKRYLETLNDGHNSLESRGENGSHGIKDAVEREMTYIESLVTSPLSKHTKASTLWAQRFWIISRFTDHMLPNGSIEESEELWRAQMVVVMKAGERHPKNYYAWHHLRQLHGFLVSRTDGKIDSMLCLYSIPKIHQWCLMHPRDISGWSFTIYLINISIETLQAETTALKDFHDVVAKIRYATEDFVSKYEWTGNSIGHFIEFLNMHFLRENRECQRS